MSPRVPIRLLSMLLLLVAVLDLIVLKVGWLPLALTVVSVAAGLALAALADVVRKTRVALGVRAWEVGPSLAPPAAAAHGPEASRSAAGTDLPAARRTACPRWVPEAISLVHRFAVLLLVVTTVMALRTALALELLAQ